jgi:hypothetical protein
VTQCRALADFSAETRWFESRLVQSPIFSYMHVFISQHGVMNDSASAHVTSDPTYIFRRTFLPSHPPHYRVIPKFIKMHSVFYQFDEDGDIEVMICNTRDHFEGEDFPVRTFSLDRVRAEDVENVLVFPVHYNVGDCVPAPPNTPSSEDMVSADLDDADRGDGLSVSAAETDEAGDGSGSESSTSSTEREFDRDESEDETPKADVRWSIQDGVLHVDYGDMADLQTDPLFRGFRIHVVMRRKSPRWACVIL